MSKVLIINDGDDWNVWLGCEGEGPKEANSLVIGVGSSRDAAVADAVRELERLTTELQSPVGVIPERTEEEQIAPAWLRGGA